MQGAHQQFAAGRIMIMGAPNGARRAKVDHPELPVTADELAACAADLLEAGVSVLHLHVRDREGRHTLDPDAYRSAMRRIRRRTGDALILQVTTEAAGRYAPEAQMSVVRQLRPDAVSLALRELCPKEDSEAAAAAFFAFLVNERIWPQYILHSVEDLQRFDAMRRRGVFGEDDPSCLLVLGRYADGHDGDPTELRALLSSVDCRRRFSWSVCCFGPREGEVMLAALKEDGHVRIGFENNLLLSDGSTAPDNAALIRQFTAALEGHRRRPATADEVRNEFIGEAS